MGKKSKQNVPKNTDYVIKYIFVVESLSHVGLFCDSMDCSPPGSSVFCPWGFPGKNTGVGCLQTLKKVLEVLRC